MRSRTATLTQPSRPSMTDESSPDAGPSRFSTLPSTRRSSRSISSTTRPIISITSAGPHPTRAKSYHSPSNSLSGPSTAPVNPIPSLLASPTAEGGKNVRSGLKRRLSTPRMGKVTLEGVGDDVDVDNLDLATGKKDSVKFKDAMRGKGETRARSTSTSVVPHPLMPDSEKSGPFALHSAPPLRTFTKPYYSPFVPSAEPDPSTSILTAVYNIGESSLLRFARWIKPKRHRLVRRASEDSEKGLVGDDGEGDLDTIDSVESTVRTSSDSIGRDGRYWIDDKGYFSLPPTPPKTHDDEFAASLGGPSRTTLPTPALSRSSLSRLGQKSTWTPGTAERDGWWSVVYRVWAGITPSNSGGKTGEVIRELGWTVALMAGMFVVTAAVALWMIQCMPITQLKHIPRSTTDLQLLSAEMRSYMASGDVGWYHTVGMLTFVGCWKHAWSVPGAVVLNILVGSVFDPIPALALLTFITATGSLLSYLLSRPLAPLIAVLFPKPLSLVRAALAPESIPTPPISARSHTATQASTDSFERITPIQLSSDPTAEPIGSSKSSVWRRLLIMRAMGFVPWSGMNVACGVVGVDWKVFWLTTAAGSASWSYVTASVGNILSRLAIPGSHEAGMVEEDVVGGESLTSLLKDPVLITKLVFLSALTLLPVILKRRGSSESEAASEVTSDSGSYEMDQVPEASSFARANLDHLAAPPTALARLDLDALSPVPGTPSSPLTKSLKNFTPTPAVFDLLSFGRTAARQGIRGAQGVGKKVVGGLRGVGRNTRS